MPTIRKNSRDRRTKQSPNEKEVRLRISLPSLPKVFIASSSTALKQAREIERRLREEEIAEVILWKGAFPLGGVILNTLREYAAKVDFAVVLFTAEDEKRETGVLSREKNSNRTKKSTEKKILTPEEQLGPRDNCVFELGLFMGALGLEPRRALLLRARNSKLLSDLEGLVYADLPLPAETNKQRTDAIKLAVKQIKDSVKDLGYCFNHPPFPAPRIIPKDRLMDLEKRKPGGQLLEGSATEVLIQTAQPLELNHGLAKTVCENMGEDIGYTYFFEADPSSINFFTSLVSTLAASSIKAPKSERINDNEWRALMRRNPDKVGRILDTLSNQLRIYFRPDKPEVEFCVHNASHDNEAICYMRYSADSFVEWFKGENARYMANGLRSKRLRNRNTVFQGSLGWDLYEEENSGFLEDLKIGLRQKFPDGRLTDRVLEICFGDKPQAR